MVLTVGMLKNFEKSNINDFFQEIITVIIVILNTVYIIATVKLIFQDFKVKIYQLALKLGNK